jgi:hypothetical protein
MWFLHLSELHFQEATNRATVGMLKNSIVLRKIALNENVFGDTPLPVLISTPLAVV